MMSLAEIGLRSLLAAYDRNNATQCDELRFALRTSVLHKGRVEHAHLILYTDRTFAKVDVEGTIKLYKHWRDTSNTSASQHDGRIAFKIGEQPYESLPVAKTQEDVLRGVFAAIDAGAHDSDLGRYIPDCPR